MAVPIFEDFLYPFLKLIAQRDMSTKEMRKAIIDYFGLTDDDCNLPTRSGNTTQLSDRLNWTRQYLRRAKFVDLPSRGIYRITERGKEYLTTHSDLRKKDLLAYSEFASYANGNSEQASKPSKRKPSPSAQPEGTPTEQLETAYSSIIDDLTSELLQKIREQSPEFFEHLVIDVLTKMGYGTSSVVTRYVKDGGIDGIIFEDKLGLGRINVQAKRYAEGNNIGLDPIQRFAGALDGHHTTKGIFITTSDYTKDAREFVKTAQKSIVLINGEELAKYMVEYNVGVSVKNVYEIKKIDNDYFEE